MHTRMYGYIIKLRYFNTILWGIWDVVINVYLQELVASDINEPGCLVSYYRQHYPQKKRPFRSHRKEDIQ